MPALTRDALTIDAFESRSACAVECLRAAGSASSRCMRHVIWPTAHTRPSKPASPAQPKRLVNGGLKRDWPAGTPCNSAPTKLLASRFVTTRGAGGKTNEPMTSGAEGSLADIFDPGLGGHSARKAEGTDRQHRDLIQGSALDSL